eukprot:1597033-Prymnesium_polylepis.1
MAWLQVQAHAHCLPHFGRKRLRIMRPRSGIEVDEHVVASAQVAPRLNVGDLQEPRPYAVQLLGKFSCPRVARAAVHTDGEVALAKLEARRALQVNVALLCLRQQSLANKHHRAVLEGCDARPFKRRLLEEGVADLGGCGRRDFGHTPV